MNFAIIGTGEPDLVYLVLGQSKAWVNEMELMYASGRQVLLYELSSLDESLAGNQDSC